MAITTLSMVLTVMVLNLHSISDRPVPRWMQVVILEYMAKLFCQCDYNEEKQRKAKSLTSNHVKKKKVGHATFNHSLRSLPHIGGDDSDVEQVPIIALNGGINTANGDPGSQSTGFVYVRNNGNHTPTRKYSTPKRATHMQDSSNEPQTSKPDYGKDWQKLAEIVDRLFFWLFLLAIIAISLLLFHPLVKDTTLKLPSR